jgi:hypothetical protein
MLYEILDPGNYMLPDVNVDFTHITLEELPPQNGAGRVLVKGARGKPAPASYKASITLVEGWRVCCYDASLIAILPCIDHVLAD